jgi:hypothetical protein
LVVPTAFASGRSSWNCRSIKWQVEQETAPSRLSRLSKNNVAPKAAAAGSSATLLVGSCGSGGRAVSASEAIVSRSAWSKSDDQLVDSATMPAVTTPIVQYSSRLPIAASLNHVGDLFASGFAMPGLSAVPAWTFQPQERQAVF